MEGEKVSAQLLLWTAEDVSQVECRFSNLVSEGNTLPATVAQARFVRYVMTDEFGPGCGRRKPGDFPASLAPDMLDNLECFNLEAKTARPVWLTISVPSDALAGNYRGKVTIYAKGKRNRDFDISLEVVDRLLPSRRNGAITSTCGSTPRPWPGCTSLNSGATPTSKR